jgi:hypothetical protein
VNFQHVVCSERIVETGVTGPQFCRSAPNQHPQGCPIDAFASRGNGTHVMGDDLFKARDFAKARRMTDLKHMRTKPECRYIAPKILHSRQRQGGVYHAPEQRKNKLSNWTHTYTIGIALMAVYTATEKSPWWLAKAIYLRYGAQLQRRNLCAGSRHITLSNPP